jgi:hypothetical protein
MTEDEWLTCTDVMVMLNHLSVWQNKRGRWVGLRKLRLFCCTYLRHRWSFLVHDYSRNALETAERLADDMASVGELDQAARQANRVVTALRNNKRDSRRLSAATGVACLLNEQFGGFTWHWFPIRYFDCIAEEPPILLRDLMGNIFSPVYFDPDWRTGNVLDLAQAAYDHRSMPTGHLDCIRLAILADALEEAGCTSSDVLDHLRRPGPHVRGCWAVDLSLGLN